MQSHFGEIMKTKSLRKIVLLNKNDTFSLKLSYSEETPNIRIEAREG